MRFRGELYRLGIVPYQWAWALQHTLLQARLDERATDTVLLLEHPPTYTIGRRVKDPFSLINREAQIRAGIPLFQVERGGLVTYHGPGQLVGYPILLLKSYCRGPRAYVRMLEEVLIKLLAEFQVQASRRNGLVGVWVDNRKIAAIGVRITRGITMHGFALNLTNDLAPYDWIIPCGLEGCQVTSLAKETGVEVDGPALAGLLRRCFEDVFGIELAIKPLHFFRIACKSFADVPLERSAERCRLDDEMGRLARLPVSPRL